MGAVRVVFDTNVLISALGWDAKPEACLEQVLHGHVEGYISPDMLDELTRVMDYPRFAFTDEEQQSFLEIILASFHIVEPGVSLDVVDDDPDDDMVLECAVASDADYIVSGDSHLLEVDAYESIAIVSPAEFLDIREQGSGS